MATASARKIFVNLAVEDLDRSVRFFTQLGFSFDQRFTDERATCMIINDEALVMLLVKDRFRDFTKKEICDSNTHTEAILALSAESREGVEEVVQKALAAGAREPTTSVITGSCTAGASTTPMVTSGRFSGWIRARFRVRLRVRMAS